MTRVYNDTYNATRILESKEPRWTLEISLDDGNADLLYITSHEDGATGGGGSNLVITFTSGGTNELMVGDDLEEGVGPDAVGEVVSINLTSGSWAGGDAAGTVEVNVTSGTFSTTGPVTLASWDGSNFFEDQLTLQSSAAASAGFFNRIRNISDHSLRLDIQNASTSIGDLNFDVLDIDGEISAELNDNLLINVEGMRHKRVRLYAGFRDFVWADYVLRSTHLVETIQDKDNNMHWRCKDPGILTKQEIMQPDKVFLGATISETDLIIPTNGTLAQSTTAFLWNEHDAGYSESPSVTEVAYIKIENEVIRLRRNVGGNDDGALYHQGGGIYGFEVDGADGRGVFGTVAAGHQFDNTETNPERQLVIEEFIYLEGSGPNLAHAILTGTDLNGNEIPSTWSAGIDTAFVRESDFEDIGEDLHDPADVTAGRRLSFQGVKKADAKTFIEKEILTFLGCYWIIHADGEIGLRRLNPVASEASYSQLLDQSNITGYTDLVHQMPKVLNRYAVEWDWTYERNKFRRTAIVIDSVSIGLHKRTQTKRWKFKGLHTLGTVETDIYAHIDMWRDRFSNPPQEMTVKALLSDTIEVGDLVRVDLTQITDYTEGGALERTFEVHNVTTNYDTGEVTLKLFGALGVAAEEIRNSLTTIMDDAWYATHGTNLGDHANVTVSGNAVTATTGPIGTINTLTEFYHEGPLTINAGVTLEILGTVCLAIRGALTINGDIDGEGGGPVGGLGQTSGPWPGNHSIGLRGYFGVTKAQGGTYIDFFGTSRYPDNQGALQAVVWRRNTIPGLPKFPITLTGIAGTMPNFYLRVTDSDADGDGDDIVGLPSRLDGNSGPGGYAMHLLNYTTVASAYQAGAGNGGAGGAGLLIISRGGGFGPNGGINLSGEAGAAGSESTGQPSTVVPDGQSQGAGDNRWFGGSGGSGFPGGCLWVLDGNFSSPSQAELVADLTCNRPAPNSNYDVPQAFTGQNVWIYSAAPGQPDADNDVYSLDAAFPSATQDLSAGLGRVQLLDTISDPSVSDPTGSEYQIATPAAGPTIAKSTVVPPTIGVGGVVIYTLNVTWIQTVDSTASGYEVQYRIANGTYESQTVSSVSTLQISFQGQAGVTYEARYRILSGLSSDSHSNFSPVTSFLVTHEGQVVFQETQAEAITDIAIVALSANGVNLLVGVPGQDNVEVWVNNNGFAQSGADITSDSVNSALFGTGIDSNSDGSRIMIGDPGDTTNSPLGGYVAFYTRDSGGGAWTEEDNDTGAANDELGGSVAMDDAGDTAVAGAFEGTGNDGQVRIYDRSGSTWTPTTINGATGEELGRVVAISGDGSTVVAQAREGDGGRGVLRIYRNRFGWNEIDTIENSDITTILNDGDHIGDAIAINSSGSLISFTSLFRQTVWVFTESATNKLEEEPGNSILVSGFEDEVAAMTTDFDGKSETNMTIDIGATANNGTDSASFLATAAAAGGYVTADFTAGDRVSVRLYFRLETGFAQTADTRLLTIRNTANTRLASLLLVDGGGGNWNLTLEDEVNTVSTADSANFSADGTWHYCELTFANDSSDDEILGYLDGTQFGIYSLVGSSDQVDRVDFGFVDTNNVADTSQMFIDDVRIQNDGEIGVVDLSGWAETEVLLDTAMLGTRSSAWPTSLAMNDELLIVGDPEYDGTFQQSGIIDVLRINDDDSWTAVQEIEPNTPATNLRFGFTVSLGTGRVVTGTDPSASTADQFFVLGEP